MKLLASIVVLCSLFVGTNSQNNLVACAADTFCGAALQISCEELLATHDFQGSCCSLETIELTKGCRVSVTNGGNCYWFPKCGQCDPANFCDLIHTASPVNTDPCPASNYSVPNVALPVVAAPTRAPLAAGTYEPTLSMSPTMKPTCAAEPTTDAPTQMPPTSSTALVWGGFALFMSLAVSTISVML